MKDKELSKFLKTYGDRICQDCPLMKRYREQNKNGIKPSEAKP